MAANEITTPVGTLMFPSLFTAQAPQQGNGDPRYQAVLVFDPDAQKTKAFEALKEAISATANDFFKGSVPRSARNPLIKCGDTDYPQKYDGFNDDDIMIRPWSKYQPGLVDARLNDIVIESDVWAGQKWRATVVPAGYDTQGNKGVMLFLNNMQQAKADMPRLDGRKSAGQSFEALEETAESGSSSVDDGFFN